MPIHQIGTLIQAPILVIQFHLRHKLTILDPHQIRPIHLIRQPNHHSKLLILNHHQIHHILHTRLISPHNTVPRPCSNANQTTTIRSQTISYTNLQVYLRVSP